MTNVLNVWRTATPGSDGWARSPRPDAPDKYFMVSSDCHVVEPPDVFVAIDAEYRVRVPHVRVDADGSHWLICEGNRPQLVKPAPDVTPSIRRQVFEPASASRRAVEKMEPEDLLRTAAGKQLARRIVDQRGDGIDAEIVFPTQGLLCWATHDPRFAAAMCRTWNDWAREYFDPSWDTSLPMALVSGTDVDSAVTEVQRAADAGFKGVLLSNSPRYGHPEPGERGYNDPRFDPLWAAIAEAGLPITFHVSTGRDPRAVTGDGGALINYVCHAMTTTIEPLVQLIASGVFVRHPRLRAGMVESGIGAIPWVLESLDHAFTVQHFWVRPVLPELPSHYFKQHCFATFQVDDAGLALIERTEITENVLWANDYPHHEGTWPHSAEAIERSMGHLDETTRAKALGLNAARIFGIDATRSSAA